MKLNNITKIYSVACKSVKGFVRVSETAARVSSDGTPWVLLEGVKYPAALTVSDKIEDKSRLFTAKLSFSTCEEWLSGNEKTAFLCVTADGDRYLVGTDERPYPVVTQQQNHPEEGKSTQLTQVTVQWTVPFLPPKLL